MQLKRETEYALRILFRVVENGNGVDGPPAGLNLLEICTDTGVPRTAAQRICEQCEAAGLLRSELTANRERQYFPGQALDSESLGGVIALMENGTNLFAVFDRGSAMYRSQGRRFEEIQTSVQKILGNIKISDLLARE